MRHYAPRRGVRYTEHPEVSRFNSATRRVTTHKRHIPYSSDPRADRLAVSFMTPAVTPTPVEVYTS